MKAEELKLFLELAEKAGSDTSEACEYMSKLKKSVKEAILAAHLEKYNIYFCESDGRYHSYLPDETRPKNRKPIAKKTREDLEEAIVTFYLSRDEQEKEQKERVSREPEDGAAEEENAEAVCEIAEDEIAAADLAKETDKAIPEGYDDISRILFAIWSQYCDPALTPRRLAALVNCDPSTVYRRFKRVTGTTSGEYLIQYRLYEATLKLRFTGLDIGEIARMSGFANESYFCRLFKSRYQVTPGEFRRQAVEARRQAAEGILPSLSAARL